MKTRTALTALAAALASTAWALPASAENRPMTVEDLVNFKRVGAPSVSPDGTMLLYSLSSAKEDYSGRKTSYALRTLDGNEAVDIDLAGAGGARFGGDGAIWYVSSASGSDQIWRREVGGEAMQVSDLAGGAIDDFVLSPDASNIVLLATRSLECSDFACADVEVVDQGGDAYEYDEIFVRHWDTWTTPGEKSQLYGFQIAGGKMVGGGAVIGQGLTGNTPSRPFGGTEEIAVSNDGIVYFAQRAGGAGEPNSTNLDLYAAPLDGSIAAVNLTDANEAHDNLPALSPDGKWLAYAAMARPTYEADKLVVMLRDLATGETRALTDDWNLSVGSIGWTPDGRSLIVGVGEIQEHPLYRIDVATGERHRLTRDGNAGNAVPLEDGRIVFTMNNLANPTEIFVYAPEGGTVTQHSYVNADALKDLDPVEWEKFSFEGADGDTVWGFRLKPANAEGELPVAFVVHGGPQGSFGNSWSNRWNPRALSGGRYAVVSVDFHGSTGYGQDFTDSINNDWGGKPLVDLQLGLEHALERYPELAGDRICALGASYGGFMMNWIAGNWSDRFDCLVNHDGIFDQRSMYYTTEELWFPEWEMGGPYYEAPENYERWNPANYVTNWQTPMLVIHGMKDYRVPPGQGLATFTALQRQKIPSKLLIFPEENHWVLNGANSIRWHHEVHEWLDRWTAPGVGQAEE